MSGVFEEVFAKGGAQMAERMKAQVREAKAQTREAKAQTREAKAQAREAEARAEAKMREMALRMLGSGALTIDQVVAFTGLDREVVEEMARRL